MRLSTPALFFLLLTLLTLACRSDKETTPSEKKSSSFIMYEFDRSSASCATDSNQCARFTARFPLVQSNDFPANVRDRINSQTQQQVLEANGLLGSLDVIEDFESQCTAFFDDYQDYLAFSESNALPWTIETQGEVVTNNEQVLVIGLDSYQFTGGAHPNSQTRLLNFDVETGKLLTWNNILTDSMSFLQLAEAVFRNVRSIGPNVDFDEVGFFWGESFRPPNNFSLESTGLRLFYNTYEIAPYVLGPTEFVLPYTDLQGVIKNKYLSID